MEGNSLSSYLNLCKIFEMRIKLDKEKNVKTSIDVLDNYEKYSKKIDNIYNSEFQKALKPLISPAVTLEKEKDRLRRLIKLIEDRLDKRIELENSYYESTDKYISGLQMIVSEDELNNKKERLSIISKYLDTKEEIDRVTDSIAKLKVSLLEEENKKEEYESKNKIMEDELYSSFMSIVSKDEYYKCINEDEIGNELDKISNSVSETKETLDITKESIGSLTATGMDDDYTSYIEEAERNYYNYKNKEIILKIYKLVIELEDDFKLICSKRENINELLLEKKEISDNLIISVDNELESFEKIILLQDNVLEREREILENIANYTSRINFKEDRLEELNEENNSIEVLAILREYGIIDTYDSDNIDSEDISVLDDHNNEKLKQESVNDVDETVNVDISSVEENLIPKFDLPSLEMPLDSINLEEEDNVIEEVYDPYRIVDIIDYPKTLNVGLAKLKGESVREKVNKKLNPVIEKAKTEEIKIDVLPEKDDTFVESINIPVVESTRENKQNDVSLIEESVPVWELPAEVNINTIKIDNDVNSLPVWEAVTPIIEETKQVEDIPVIDDVNILEDTEEKDNMFWVPVSDSKLATNNFPSLNLPNNINKNSEFIFPNIND